MNQRIMNAVKSVEDDYQNFGEITSLERYVAEERLFGGGAFNQV